MKKAKYDTTSRKSTFIVVLGITMLVFLVLINIADALENVHSFNRALKDADEKQLKEQDAILRNNPYDSEAWKLKAWDLQNLNRFDEALIAYDQAIKVNPLDPDAWAAKGDFLLEPLDRPAEAIKAYDIVIETKAIEYNFCLLIIYFSPFLDLHI
jgi:tetratricopeptide (TPR) repeat protein